MPERGRSPLSRRAFLHVAGLGAGALLLGTRAPVGSAAPPAGEPVPRPGPVAVVPGQSNAINVTTYGGTWKDALIKYVVQPFEQQTNARVNLSEGISTEWVAKIRAAGMNNPPYDVLICNEPPLPDLRRAGFFDRRDTASAPNINNVYEQALRGDESLILMWGAVGLAYRTDQVAMTIDSWEAPFDPMFADRRGTYTLANTLGLQMFLMYNRMYGKDEYDADAGFAALKKWLPMKIADFTGTMETYLTQGEVIIANMPDAGAAKLAKQGLPVAYGPPKEGAPALEQVAQVLKGSRNRDLAWKFLDIFLSPEAQIGFATSEYYGPTNRTVTIPEEIAPLITATPQQVQQLVFFDWAKIATQRSRWVERWNREIAS